MKTNTPPNLYKYLSVNENTIETLIKQEVYYSDPINFNDPLDCKPVITVDVEMDVLKRVMCDLLRKRQEKEFMQLAKKLHAREDSISNRVVALAETEIMKFLNEVKYNASEYDSDAAVNFIKEQYTQAIENEILSVFKKGVLCLSKKFNSPLMWSHYANNHRGICVEYDMTDVDEGTVKKIIYGGSRSLKVSLIDAWLTTGEMPSEIEQVCLLTKSSEWSYENEWRMFGRIGVGGIQSKIRSVIFGMHCKETTIIAVINSLYNSRHRPKFWKIYNPRGGFELKRNRIHPEDYKDIYSNMLTYGEIKEIFGSGDD